MVNLGILKNALLYILLETNAQKQDRLFQQIYENICKNCGAVLAEGAVFCGNCGSKQE